MKDEKFLEIVNDKKSVLIIASDPLDFDCLGSGLILKKYLESLGKIVTLMWPGKISKEKKEYFSFLPYFDEVIFQDTRQVLAKKNFDVLIFVDGGSLVQFYDTSKTSDNPPNLSTYDNRVHIDHHLDNGQILGTYTLRDTQASSTAKLILEKIIPKSFIDEKLATLAYAAILWDTGNFTWHFNDGSLEIANFLLTKGADTLFLINKIFSSYPKLRLEMLSLAIKNIEYDDQTKTIFLCFPYQKLQQEKINEEQFSVLKNAFCDEIAGKISGYDRGMLIYEKKPGQIKIAARGNNLYNKINMPEMFSKLSDQGGGHFNACGVEIKGNFQEVKKSLLELIKKGLDNC